MDNVLTVLYSLRIQDILDIIIIAVMISALLIWFKDRASRFVFIGISLLGAVYLLARFLQLYLTTIVLQGFFAILLFVLVVIFQEDLRRFFESLAMWGRFRLPLRARTPTVPSVDTIAEATTNLARNKIGALIVIHGEVPLERHLSGGTRLDGLLSQPLLESIFDPHSAGHDGAAIIENGRITRFGCHLPLSQDAERFGNLGLRHTAAIGLAERSDALCIVVSEERGTISIAQGERFNEITGASALRNVLESFISKQNPEKGGRPFPRWWKENTREKGIALLLACLLWLFFGYQKDSVRRDFTVPIEYRNLSPEWVIEEPKIAEVKLLLTGTSQAFQLLDPSVLKLSLDLSQIQKGKQDIVLARDMVNKPSNLYVASIQPGHITIVASRYVSVLVPIDVVTEKEPAGGRILTRITAVPPSITVLAPGRLQHERIRIRTEPIDLSTLKSTSVLTPRLIVPPNIQFKNGKLPTVKVVVRIRDRDSGPR
ncbi:MAG: diadenylate cyclase [Deltaproteobacteria bacterium]|nr:diadenylate cyclase [Deltaproteobacteria bacterium]